MATAVKSLQSLQWGQQPFTILDMVSKKVEGDKYPKRISYPRKVGDKYYIVCLKPSNGYKSSKGNPQYEKVAFELQFWQGIFKDDWFILQADGEQLLDRAFSFEEVEGYSPSREESIKNWKSSGYIIGIYCKGHAQLEKLSQSYKDMVVSQSLRIITEPKRFEDLESNLKEQFESVVKRQLDGDMPSLREVAELRELGYFAELSDEITERMIENAATRTGVDLVDIKEVAKEISLDPPKENESKGWGNKSSGIKPEDRLKFIENEFYACKSLINKASKSIEDWNALQLAIAILGVQAPIMINPFSNNPPLLDSDSYEQDLETLCQWAKNDCKRGQGQEVLLDRVSRGDKPSHEWIKLFLDIIGKIDISSREFKRNLIKEGLFFNDDDRTLFEATEDELKAILGILE